MLLDHAYFMQLAYQQALLAYEADEIPVGAIIVAQNRIIAKTYNQTERFKDVTAHAEILAITAASQHLGAKYLKECTLYITLEPCLMCAGALSWAQLGTLVFAAHDKRRGFSLLDQKVLHPKTQVITGVMQTECETLMNAFFQGLRQ